MTSTLVPVRRFVEKPIDVRPRHDHDVRAWVDKFGAMTADDIAAYLHSERITGVRGNRFICGLARFLNKVTSRRVSVAFKVVYVLDGPAAGTQFTLPPSLQEFVQRFDQGEWEHLHEPPPVPPRSVSEAACVSFEAMSALMMKYRTSVPVPPRFVTVGVA